MTQSFYKYQGAGNDFIIIDKRENNKLFSEDEIKNMCSRRYGIGADGFIELYSSRNYDFEMKYYNSNGKEGTMCGNGGRCIVAFAADIGLIEKNCKFDSVDGVHEAAFTDNEEIKLKMIDVDEYEDFAGDVIMQTGSPHYVAFTKDIFNIDVLKMGRSIRNDKSISENGLNVNFAELLPEEIAVRTYERGVENETHSCGTGAVATALSASFIYGVKSPVKLNFRGGNLRVFFTKDDEKYKDVWLQGPAEFVFKGKIKV